MSEPLQYIIVAIVLAACLAFAGYRLWRNLTSRSRCCTCEGCALADKCTDKCANKCEMKK